MRLYWVLILTALGIGMGMGNYIAIGLLMKMVKSSIINGNQSNNAN